MKAIGNTLLVVSMVFIMLAGVSAQTLDSSVNTPADNFLGRIISSINYFFYQSGTFTVYGDTLGCSKVPDNIINFKGTGTFDLNKYSQDSAFVNWFRGSPYEGTYQNHLNDNRQFLKEVYLEKGKVSSTSLSCDSSAYWNNECYGEIYFCPRPCYLDSDCGSDEKCDKTVLSSKIPNAGTCIPVLNGTVQIPTHKTNVYKCDNGNKTYINSVIYGDINFCSSPSDSKYLIGTTDQCLPSEPSICNTVVITKTNITISKSASLTEEEFNQAPPKLIIASMCELSSDCLPRENYSVSCIFSEDIKNINKNAVSKLTQSSGGGIEKLCWGLSDSIIGIPYKLIFGENNGCTDPTKYKDYTISGTCRAKTSGFDIMANWNGFPILYWIIGALVVLLLIIPGGKK